MKFDAKTHTYTRNKEKYISVTTLIDRYIPPFDSNYWSAYKAIKDVLSARSTSMWNNYKGTAGGWENVVAYYEKQKFQSGTSGKYSPEIEKRKQWYLDCWENENKIACDKGSRIHDIMEKLVGGSGKIEHEGSIYETRPASRLHTFEGNHIYPELIVYNDLYKVAGTIDRLDQKNKDAWINDYKTNKEITKTAFRDETMLYPLAHIPNANYFHYQLQVSLYAWIVEFMGYRIKGIKLTHLKDDGDEVYDIRYAKSDVETMLRHYKYEREW